MAEDEGKSPGTFWHEYLGGDLGGRGGKDDVGEEEKTVLLKTKSSRWERRYDWGNEGVPCNFLECDLERRRDTQDRGSGGSGAYYDSSGDNVGRLPSIVCGILEIGRAHV